MDFQGKVVIVTGGAKGIGLGAARKFAQGGASVAIVSRSGTADAAELLRDETGNKNVIGIAADVSKGDQAREMVRQTAEVFGSVDILVNSAGVQRYGTVVDTEEDVWDEVMDTNVKGMYLTSKYVIPEMRKRGGGAIVNVSSVQAYVALAGSAAYVTSKGAINSLTRAMALDHASEGIRVNCVCPGSIDTPMLRWAAELFKGDQTQEDVIDSSWGRMHPIGRVGTMEECGELIAFLCSDKAGFITGGDYKIDGGLLTSAAVVLPK
ncbi:SDR family NAD(P)-dependent oxidoreductase [Cohnella phaseoli]|uniref:NAD(P)-dependent dehydrogenase (Short-subunit alcohol dehydrogenase family) n=1 Tax=Cohnella phaseoli TaxID=456490 RepID=A0A3D9KFX0_9BACL|nr:glucose 1-dehydrogenase [Cohnella phaseoli]RED85418.1 NAD(P)-dependent dehydrogenase (short-subunit alcohol dehydrogenase family) [Cohnella phaseoli]